MYILPSIALYFARCCVLWCAFCTAGECSWLLAIRGAMDVAVAFLPYLSWLHILAYIPPPWLSLFLIVSLDPSAVSSFAFACPWSVAYPFLAFLMIALRMMTKLRVSMTARIPSRMKKLFAMEMEDAFVPSR